MGQSTSPNIPSTTGGTSLGSYTDKLVNAPTQGPDQNALAAYNATFGQQPSYQQMANAHALQLINNLPLNAGRYLVSPANHTNSQASAPPPVEQPMMHGRQPDRIKG